MDVEPMEQDEMLRKVEDILGRALARTRWNVADIVWDLHQSGLLHPSVVTPTAVDDCPF